MKNWKKIAIIVFCALVCISVVRQLLFSDAQPPSGQTNEAQPETAAANVEETNGMSGEERSDASLPFREEHALDITTSSKTLIERFTKAYKISGASKLWTIADFDDKGAIMAVSDIENINTGAMEKAVVVMTPVMDGEKMTGATPHYIAVGDVVYGDDGYCDDVFETITDAYESIQ